MHDAEREFLRIVTQVRAHLEFQQALGVRFLEVTSPELRRQIPASVKAAMSKAEAVPFPQPSPLAGSGGIDAVRAELGECTRCKLHSGRTTLVFGEGDPHARIVFIGEGPGQEEDLQGRPFVGAAGQLLTDIIVKGMKMRREDVYICNIVKCRPPNNRNPEPDEVEACAPFLRKQIQAVAPKLIVGLGNVAVKTLLKTKEGITSLRGTWHSYQGIPVMPTFHPAYLLRSPGDKKLVWEDIKKILAELSRIEKG